MNNKLFKMSSKELLEHINQNFKIKADDVPPGWFTVKQLARESNVDVRTIGRKIQSALEVGALERTVFRVALGDDVIRPCAHYRKKG